MVDFNDDAPALDAGARVELRADQDEHVPLPTCFRQS